jgi:hypothetical protein
MRQISTGRLATLIRRDAQRFEALKREIVQLDYFCKGTVLKRMMKCGNQQCACHRDPATRHGPYFECTFKVQNKTVNLKLYPEVTPLYRAAIQHHRKLKAPYRTPGAAVANRACAPCATETRRPPPNQNPGIFP